MRSQPPAHRNRGRPGAVQLPLVSQQAAPGPPAKLPTHLVHVSASATCATLLLDPAMNPTPQPTRLRGPKAVLVHATRLLRGVAVLSPWLGHLLAVDLILSLLLPLKWVAPNAVYNASSVLAHSVWAWIQTIFTRINHADIVLSTNCPGGLPRGESAVVVANHVAWSDFYMIQEAASRASMLGRCRWFAKRSLRWVPFLGWGLWAMGMPLVSRKWATDRAELERVFRGIVSKRWPVCTSNDNSLSPPSSPPPPLFCAVPAPLRHAPFTPQYHVVARPPLRACYHSVFWDVGASASGTPALPWCHLCRVYCYL